MEREWEHTAARFFLQQPEPEPEHQVHPISVLTPMALHGDGLPPWSNLRAGPPFLPRFIPRRLLQISGVCRSILQGVGVNLACVPRDVVQAVAGRLSQKSAPVGRENAAEITQDGT
jgi:hypothetical protein